MKKKIAKIIPKQLKLQMLKHHGWRKKALERYYYLLLLSFSKRFSKKFAAAHRQYTAKQLYNILKAVMLGDIMVLEKNQKPKDTPKGFRITRKIQRRPRRWLKRRIP